MTKIYLNKLSRFVCMAVVSVLFLSVPTETFANNSDAGLYQSTFDITGRVVSQDGDPIIGAMAIINNTTKGAVTDVNGVFYITNVQATDSVKVSYVGYTTLIAKAEQKMNFTLEESALVAEDVVVVGYGTQKKVNLTGAVSMIEGEALEARPVKDVSSALQGLVPGLILTQSTYGGEINSSMNVSIRGTGTIGTSSDDPLILVDGIESGMDNVNPNDIESISVLKDASASSVYGSKAAFGVILITTKTGKAGKTKINYSGNVRFNSAIGQPDPVDGYTYATYKNCASWNQNGSQLYSDDTLERIQQYMNGEITTNTVANSTGTAWSYGTANLANGNTDWWDYMYDDWVASHEHNISLSGGNENVTFSLSGQYLNQNGMLTFGTEYLKRYNLNARINIKASKWLDVNFTTKWTRNNYVAPTYIRESSGIFYHSLNRQPITDSPVDPNGYYSTASHYSLLTEGGETSTQGTVTTNQVQLIATPLKGWRIIAEGALKTADSFYHKEILPVYYNDIDGVRTGMAFNGNAIGYTEVTETASESDSYTGNIYSDYTKSWGKHNFKALVGANAELYEYRYLYGYRTDLVSAELPTLATATENDLTTGTYQHRSTAGFFARFNYDYDGKYLFQAGARYDGSSRFRADSRWGFFPSFSAGWNIAKEDFFEPIRDVVNTLKPRVAWGTLGNTNNSSNYPTYTTMSLGTGTGTWLNDGEKTNTSTMPGLVSASLTWETIETIEVGLDFGLFNNRLTGSAAWFTRYTRDMVGPANDLPATLGASVPNTNNCDMKSYGWELELSWRDKIGEFQYGVRATVEDSKQKVLKYNNSTNSLGSYYAGYELGQIRGYTTLGIAQTQDEMDEHLAVTNNQNGISGYGYGWKAGDIMYADLDGDGYVNTGSYTLEDEGDYTVIGNTTPRYRYGVTIDMKYKWFDMSMYWQGVGQRDYMPYTGMPYFFGASENNMQTVCFEEHLDFWRDADDPDTPWYSEYGFGSNFDAYYARPLMTGYKRNQQMQTRFMQDASYCRLKNLQIGYNLSKANLEKLGISSLRVYASGDNLLTFTSLTSILDPEALAGNYGGTSAAVGKIYPLSTTLSLGVNINF